MRWTGAGNDYPLPNKRQHQQTACRHQAAATASDPRRIWRKARRRHSGTSKHIASTPNRPSAKSVMLLVTLHLRITFVLFAVCSPPTTPIPFLPAQNSNAKKKKPLILYQLSPREVSKRFPEPQKMPPWLSGIIESFRRQQTDTSVSRSCPRANFKVIARKHYVVARIRGVSQSTQRTVSFANASSLGAAPQAGQ